jgi:hypothetical protein
MAMRVLTVISTSARNVPAAGTLRTVVQRGAEGNHCVCDYAEGFAERRVFIGSNGGDRRDAAGECGA